jgi:phosphoketolase
VNWLKSYRPEELFDEKGKIKQELRVVSPKGDKRMAKNPITNGGIEPKLLDFSFFIEKFLWTIGFQPIH